MKDVAEQDGPVASVEGQAAGLKTRLLAFLCFVTLGVGALALVTGSWWILVFSIFAFIPLVNAWDMSRPRAVRRAEQEKADLAQQKRAKQQIAQARIKQEKANRERELREAQLPPRASDALLMSGNQPACPNCGSTAFAMRRSGSTRARIGVATVLTGGIGGAAMWALNDKDMIECVTCGLAFRRG